MIIYVVKYLDDQLYPTIRYFKELKMAKKQIEVWKEQQEKGLLGASYIDDYPNEMYFSDNDIYNKYFRLHQKN